MKITILSVLMMLSVSLTVAQKKQIPCLIGSSQLSNYPIKVKMLDPEKVKKNSMCPLLDYIKTNEKTYRNWLLMDGNKTTTVKGMRLEKFGGIYVLTILGETYNAFIRTSTTEILKLTETELTFHNGDGSIITLHQ